MKEETKKKKKRKGDMGEGKNRYKVTYDKQKMYVTHSIYKYIFIYTYLVMATTKKSPDLASSYSGKTRSG